MRPDLNKLLCEHERSQSWRGFREVRRDKRFTENSRESMTARYGYETKSFGENLRPLYGAVRKAIGRRWDSFYSDLCKNFNMRSVINQHILQHLEQYCERDLQVGEDGEIYFKQVAYRSGLIPLKGSTTEFYVDPRDGIIKRNKWRKTYRQRDREREKKDPTMVQIDKDNVLHKIANVWFHFTLKDAPRGEYLYTKPPGEDGFLLHKYEKKPRLWERLRDYEKKKVGVRKFVGETVTDLFEMKNVFTERKDKKALRYHATKKTASRAVLKRAGLVA